MAYTNIDDPSAYFQVQDYTGSGADRSVTNTGNSDLQPDLVWIKTDSNTSHMWQDSTRGVTKYLSSNNTSAEGTASSVIQAFQTDGFSLPAGGGNNVDGEESVAWQWKAGGGSTSTNATGDITSTLQTNSTAGFTIGTYTGNGTDNQTIAHGLGQTPDWIIVKRRSGTANWAVWGNYNSVNHIMRFSGQSGGESDSASGRVSGRASNSRGTSTIFTVYQGSSAYGNTNENNETYVFYAWAQKQGFSKFGKYIGNGSTDGSFVYLGFRPALIITKKFGTSGWFVQDIKRGIKNQDTNTPVYQIQDNYSQSATGTTDYEIDFLSNGFKLRDDNTYVNASNQEYAYMAFAENPFVTSTGIPTTAR